MTGLPCPNCGSELSFLEQYNRHYCYSCNRYAPEGFAEGGPKKCPNCGGILSFVAAYGLQYCYRCGIYPPGNAIMEWTEPVAQPIPESEPQSTLPETGTAPVEAAKSEGPPAVAGQAQAQTASQAEETDTEERRDVSTMLAKKPPLVREVIEVAKKPGLMDLCKAYDLDPNGTKEALRERLLSYLDELEAEASQVQPEEIYEEEPQETEVIEAAPEEAPATADEASATERVTPEEILHEESVEYVTRPAEQTPAPAATTAVVAEQTKRAAYQREQSPVVYVQETVVARAPTTATQPCPTCGRDLTYISVYSRWYCYSCRTYAPKSRNVCPNCGASLRWIEQYERWWCESCRRYAPSDLPRPERPRATAASSVTSRATGSATATTLYMPRHRNVGSGLGLIGLGIALFIVYEVLVDLPTALSSNFGIPLSSDVAWGMRFFSILFIAGGAMLGILSVRDQR